MIKENKKENFKKELDNLLKKYSVTIGIDSNLSIEEMEFAELDIIFIDESADNEVLLYGNGWLYDVLSF